MKYFLLSIIFLTSCAVNKNYVTSQEKINVSKDQADYSNLGNMQRRVTKRNIREVLDVLSDRMTKSNIQIATKVCINRVGTISYAELIENETTTKLTSSEKKQVLRAIYKYKYEAKSDAPESECGKLTIKIN